MCGTGRVLMTALAHTYGVGICGTFARCTHWSLSTPTAVPVSLFATSPATFHPFVPFQVGEPIKQGDDSTKYLDLDQLNFLAMHPVRRVRLDFDPAGGEKGDGQLVETRDVVSENGLMKTEISPNRFVDRIVGNYVTPLVQALF